MSKDKTDKRVKKLFSGIQLADSKPFHDNDGADRQVVAASPVSNPVMLLQDVETLRARVAELEARLQEKETSRPSTPIIDKKEQVDFTSAEGVLKTSLVLSGEVQEAQTPEEVTHQSTQRWDNFLDA